MFSDLNKQFGVEFIEKEIKPRNGLPVYMTSGRKMYELACSAGSFIVVCISEMDRFGVVALKKQIEQYEESFGSHVAFSFTGLTKFQRDSLIKHGIPFLALPGQIYLPFLGMMLTNSFKKEKEVSLDKMMPATQCLYLYLLSRNGEAVSKALAADAVGLTRMSISRASEQLEGMDLITQENVGKSVYMKLKAYGNEGFELAKPYLINPVKKTLMVKAYDGMTSIPVAGETALASYSMLQEPAILTKAISKDSEIISSLEETDEKWDPDSACIRLQIWKYDPALFSQNGVVDRVSLAMSFEDNSDERIEEALEVCMEGLNDQRN